MITFLRNSLMLAALIALTHCGGGDTAQTEDTETTGENEAANTSEEVKKYSLSPVSSPEFDDASLAITNLDDDAQLPNGPYTFEFAVENYELGAQTEDAEGKGLANSGKGQHIHVIVDNQPYSAHYEPKAEKELEEGSHIMLAFLSRSYHESVKNGKAYILKKFTVGEAEPMELDFSAPHMFYSRPKGDYTMNEGDKLLLDFFLLNAELSPEGNKVRATINGEEHLIDQWAPYAIEGLELGEVNIKLELIDAEGNVIDGPFNTVERSVKLLAPEAQ